MSEAISSSSASIQLSLDLEPSPAELWHRDAARRAVDKLFALARRCQIGITTPSEAYLSIAGIMLKHRRSAWSVS